MIRFRRLWWVLSFLMLMSLLLVSLFEWGPRRQLAIVPNPQWAIQTMDDRAVAGASEATLGPDGVEMQCTLREGARWPFCELMIVLASPEQGVDLSDYDSMILQLQSEGPSDAPWRIYLRNYDPAYSRLEDPVSHKVNAILFDSTQYPGRVEVPLTLFTPTTWWLTDYQIPLMQQGRDLSRVFAIELATGSNALAGHYRLKLEELTFQGPWLSPSLFYRALFMVWSITIIMLLLMDYAGMRRRLQKASHNAHLAMLRNQNLEQEYRMAADQVRHDPLTGALSRSEGEALLAQHSGEMIVIFIDIDHFKQINDGYGHPVGDEVIKCLVSELLLHLGQEVSLCRWGGEEFVLLVPERPLSWGETLAEHLRKVLAEGRGWPQDLRVSASFGVAARRRQEPLPQTLARADDALYQAKRDGRNRVVVAH